MNPTSSFFICRWFSHRGMTKSARPDRNQTRMNPTSSFFMCRWFSHRGMTKSARPDRNQTRMNPTSSFFICRWFSHRGMTKSARPDRNQTRMNPTSSFFMCRWFSHRGIKQFDDRANQGASRGLEFFFKNTVTFDKTLFFQLYRGKGENAKSCPYQLVRMNDLDLGRFLKTVRYYKKTKQRFTGGLDEKRGGCVFTHEKTDDRIQMWMIWVIKGD